MCWKRASETEWYRRYGRGRAAIRWIRVSCSWDLGMWADLLEAYFIRVNWKSPSHKVVEVRNLSGAPGGWRGTYPLIYILAIYPEYFEMVPAMTETSHDIEVITWVGTLTLAWTWPSCQLLFEWWCLVRKSSIWDTWKRDSFLVSCDRLWTVVELFSEGGLRLFVCPALWFSSWSSKILKRWLHHSCNMLLYGNRG